MTQTVTVKRQYCPRCQKEAEIRKVCAYQSARFRVILFSCMSCKRPVDLRTEVKETAHEAVTGAE
jgi:hypothetical protein